jgi:class 3 adenylate cyclase/tetratricopeptide (TPR) repeat protein
MQGSLPTGTVTFAFTDIEGSTVRWERDRVRMQAAVRRHDVILRAAIVEHGGHIFKTIGDAFCAAFARPEEAVAAMLAAQLALRSEDFSAVDGLRIRAALHSGIADERDGDYFGPPVNKVARLLGIGHGSQLLLSSETAALLDGTLANDASLRDLGAYRLKDFAQPQRVYQLLAPTLPLDFPPLRSLGTLPSNSSIIETAQFRPVPSFSGRDAELAAVHAALRSDGAIAVVHGMGGVGKSSVAREYGWHNRDGYSVIWWLNAQTEAGIIDSLVRLGAMFVQGLDQLDDRRAAAQRVLHSVLGGFDKPVLLVFDNLEEEGLLRTWLPRTARALATSRGTAWSTDIIAIPLPVWSVDTAADYLLRASGRADLSAETAQAITRALGALPLALSHAAAALRNLRMVSPQRYLGRINEHLKNAPRGAEYPRSVFATFSTAIAQAEQQAAGAAAMLCFAASFAPDAIPDELFRQNVEHYAEGLRPSLSEGAAIDLRFALADELRLDEALGALDRLSLLAFAEGSETYSMHRLVQLAAQDLTGNSALAWRACAIAVADATMPDIEFENWPQCERVLVHARAALETLSNDVELGSVARLANRCGRYLWARGDYAAAVSLATRALAIREQALGPGHPEVATSLNNLAMVYNNQGRYAEAELLCTRALSIWEQALGPDHLDGAESLGNLAQAYREQGKYADAEVVCARALAIREQAFGPAHLDVAESLCSLAQTYHCQGRHAEAEPLHTRALAIVEQLLGPDHPDVAAILGNLSIVYRNQGRYAEAEPLQSRALAIRQEALGPNHPDVAISLNNLASVYRDQARSAEAEPLLRRALGISEEALGPDHPIVASVLNNLANVYRAQRRPAEAEPLYARALAIREQTFGPEHPHVALSLNDLALMHRDQGNHDEAEPLFARVLSIRERALGPENPLTEATRESLNTLRSRE